MIRAETSFIFYKIIAEYIKSMIVAETSRVSPSPASRINLPHPPPTQIPGEWRFGVPLKLANGPSEPPDVILLSLDTGQRWIWAPLGKAPFSWPLGSDAAPPSQDQAHE